MEYKAPEPSGTQCSVCEGFNMMLNQYGVCARCWSNMEPEERAAIEGTEPPLESRIVTYSIPVLRARWLYLAALVGSAVGTAVLALLAKWMRR